MIEGLIVSFKTDELREHLIQRAKLHEGKVDFYTEKAKLNEDVPEQENVTVDVVKNLKDRAQTHRQRADHFYLLADHLIIGEEYRLSENDLLKLEFIGRYL